MKRLFRPLRPRLIFGGLLLWAVLLVSCVVTERTLVLPNHVPGATTVGSAACAKCHAGIVRGFHDATHARLTTDSGDGAVRDVSCEACHGGGSLHVKAGTRATILNPKGKPETCLQCHIDTRAELALPHDHPVLAGRVGCADCHEPHTGDASRPEGARSLFSSANATCARCHPAQSATFVFQHEVVREGCVTCHAPHGAVNAKLLKARGTSLCYQCHFQPQNGTTQLLHGGFNHAGGQQGNIMTGTCWSAGCHEAVHGSNVNSNLRF